MGPESRAVGEALLTLPSGRREGIRALAGQDALILLGDALPWHEAVTWIAPHRPDLWLPTTRRPDMPIALLVRALGREHPQLAPPWLVLPGRVFSLVDALPLDDGKLSAWLAS